jgi:streptogramin lyase
MRLLRSSVLRIRGEDTVRALRSLLLFGLVLGQTIAVAATPAQAGRRGREFHVPTPGSGPWGAAVGPDRSLWFTDYDGNKIGYVRPSRQPSPVVNAG